MMLVVHEAFETFQMSKKLPELEAYDKRESDVELPSMNYGVTRVSVFGWGIPRPEVSQ